MPTSAERISSAVSAHPSILGHGPRTYWGTGRVRFGRRGPENPGPFPQPRLGPDCRQSISVCQEAAGRFAYGEQCAPRSREACERGFREVGSPSSAFETSRNQCETAKRSPRSCGWVDRPDSASRNQTGELLHLRTAGHRLPPPERSLHATPQGEDPGSASSGKPPDRDSMQR
jgi:hypothetical protein